MVCPLFYYYLLTITHGFPLSEVVLTSYLLYGIVGVVPTLQNCIDKIYLLEYCTLYVTCKQV